MKIDVLDKGYVELTDKMGSDLKVVATARVSYLSEPESYTKDKKLIRYLLENGHTSPFEHVVFTFLVKCPIFVARQWMRHRTWSYNEVSRRYTSDEIDFHIPIDFRKQSKDNKQMSEGYIEDYGDTSSYVEYLSRIAESFYDIMLEEGIAREQARMILPTNLYTKFYATVDLHNLLHFISIRNHPHAQEEIRVYAIAMLDLIRKVVPWTIEAWEDINKRRGLTN